MLSISSFLALMMVHSNRHTKTLTFLYIKFLSLDYHVFQFLFPLSLSLSLSLYIYIYIYLNLLKRFGLYKEIMLITRKYWKKRNVLTAKTVGIEAFKNICWVFLWLFFGEFVLFVFCLCFVCLGFFVLLFFCNILRKPFLIVQRWKQKWNSCHVNIYIYIYSHPLFRCITTLQCG